MASSIREASENFVFIPGSETFTSLNENRIERLEKKRDGKKKITNCQINNDKVLNDK